MKDFVSDNASSYADSVKDLAGDARRAVTERSARLSRQTQAKLQSSMQRLLREQPLAVAVAGLAAGAAVSALFPSSEVEVAYWAARMRSSRTPPSRLERESWEPPARQARP
jgi:hypothetical protein